MNDPVAVHSSIALLQERFRQLQRVKEMREEKELLRMLGTGGTGTHDPPSKHPGNIPASPNYEPFKLFFRPDRGFPMMGTATSTTSPPQLSLSLWPCPRTSGGSCLRSMEVPMLIVGSRFPGARFSITNMSDKSENFDDVDTSLHL